MFQLPHICTQWYVEEESAVGEFRKRNCEGEMPVRFTGRVERCILCGTRRFICDDKGCRIVEVELAGKNLLVNSL